MVMAFLRKLDGGQRLPLRGRLTVIGRDPACDVPIRMGQVSGRHAIILQIGGDYYVEDLQSLNGTYVNGRRVTQRTRLAAGDRLEIPGTALTFHEDEPAAVPVQGGTTFSLTEQSSDTAPPAIISSLDVAAAPRLGIAPEAKLRAVLEIANSLGTTLALDKVLATVLESLFNLFPQATRGFILLRDPATGQLSPSAVRQRGGRAAGPPAVSRTLIDHALATGKAVLSADAGMDQRFNASESIRLLRLHSVMCVPMVTRAGATLGVIQIDAQHGGLAFREEDLDVLIYASVQAARAIELARLHAELRDLEAATRIQQSFLPEARPRVAGLTFFDHYSPAQQVGGDYYDYIPLPGNRLAVTLGDVAGKGISAALLMARLSAAARFCLATAPTAADAVRQINQSLARTFREDRFVTFVAAVLDLDRSTLTLVNAGHLPPLVRHPGRPAAELLGDDIVGLPLAGIDQPYDEITVPLEPGDLVVLYTDGVTEARNPVGEFFGPARLRAVVEGAPPDAEAVGAAILADVKQFANGRPPHDDLTLVCFGRGVG
jgi:serine phosphatase RsbU (regulator of sigma subunit)